MTLRVFLIEDNPSIRDLLVGLLEDATACEVIAVAESEDQALHWLASNGDRWDLLVADLFLTEGSGMEVVKACARRLPHQRVVVLTNYAEAANDRALSQGADAVFDKAGQFEDFLTYASQCASAR
jgi:DNA-binding NarL/FixJ family response regulator